MGAVAKGFVAGLLATAEIDGFRLLGREDHGIQAGVLMATVAQWL